MSIIRNVNTTSSRHIGILHKLKDVLTEKSLFNTNKSHLCLVLFVNTLLVEEQS